MNRVLVYLEIEVLERRIDPIQVAENLRSVLSTLPDRATEGCPEWWWRRQLPRRISNVIWKCIAEIERLKNYDIALNHLSHLLDNHVSLLGKKRRGKVFIRFMICQGHLGSSESVVEAAKRKFEFLKNSSSDPLLYPADVAEIERRIAGVSINKHEWPCGEICERQVVISGAKNREFNWVEQAAIDHYYVGGDGGYEFGTHCEGRVMMEIFSVLFKQRVLLPVASTEAISCGLIQSPIQKWALDVGFLEEVSPARWTAAMEIVDELQSHDFENLAIYYGTAIAANGITEITTDSMEILKCMRGSVLAAIMKLMITDPYYWGGGQPDLIVWNATEKTVCFAEVKGPGDQLSPRQRWWLAYLRDAGATAEVCWVLDEPKEKVVREKVVKKKKNPMPNAKGREKKRKSMAQVLPEQSPPLELIILSSQTDIEEIVGTNSS